MFNMFFSLTYMFFRNNFCALTLCYFSSDTEQIQSTPSVTMLCGSQSRTNT